MASYEVLKEIVRNGSNLILYNSIDYDVMRELVQIARTTGSQVTLPTSISYDVISELSSLGKSNVTFMNGFDATSVEEIKKEIRRIKS
jgi:hypothetical protein